MTTIWAMLAIVLIMLLGSLFWTSLGALVGATSKVASTISLPRLERVGSADLADSDRPQRHASARRRRWRISPAATSTPLPAPIVEPEPTATPAPPTAAPAPTAQPTTAAKPTAVADGGRSPWVLLQAGPTRTVSQRIRAGSAGQGDAAITSIRLELDGVAVPTTTEDRGGSTWRGFASVNVSTGKHSARAVVTDAQGRTGAYRWNFEAR